MSVGDAETLKGPIRQRRVKDDKFYGITQSITKVTSNLLASGLFLCCLFLPREELFSALFGFKSVPKSQTLKTRTEVSNLFHREAFFFLGRVQCWVR